MLIMGIKRIFRTNDKNKIIVKYVIIIKYIFFLLNKKSTKQITVNMENQANKPCCINGR